MADARTVGATELLKSERLVVNQRCRQDWEDLILQWVHDEPDRQMVSRQLLDGKMIAQIAEEFNLSDQQTKARLKRAKKQLFSHI